MDNNQTTNIHEFSNFDEDEPQFTPRQEYKRKRLLFSPPRRVIPPSGASLFLENNYIVMPTHHGIISPEKKHSRTPQNITEEQPDVFIRKQGHTRPVTPSRRLFSPPSMVTTPTSVSQVGNLQVVREVDYPQFQDNPQQKTPKRQIDIVSPETHATQVAMNMPVVSQISPIHEVHIRIPEYAKSLSVDESNYFNFQENHNEMNPGNMSDLCHQNEFPLPTNQQPDQQNASKIFPSSDCKENGQGSFGQTEQESAAPTTFIQYTERQFYRLWNEIETLRATVHKQGFQIKEQNELIQKLQDSIKTEGRHKKMKSSSSSSSSSTSSASSSDNGNLSSASEDDNNEKKDDKPNQPSDANNLEAKISNIVPVEVATPNKTSIIKMKPAPSRLISCSLCPREYKTMMALTCHMSKNHGVNAQPGTSSASQPQAPRGTSSATVCKYCDKIFHNHIRCQQHIKVAHERFRIQCDRCGGYFPDHQQLKEHLKEHNGLMEPANEINPLHCPTGSKGSRKKCREIFHCKQNLRHHLWRKHFITGEDAEKCVERAELSSNFRRGTTQDKSSVNVVPSISSQQ